MKGEHSGNDSRLGLNACSAAIKPACLTDFHIRNHLRGQALFAWLSTPQTHQKAAYGLPGVPCLMFRMRKHRESAQSSSFSLLVFPGPVLGLEADHLQVPSLALVWIRAGPAPQPGSLGGRSSGGAGRQMPDHEGVTLCVCLVGAGALVGAGGWWIGMINVVMLIIHLSTASTASFSHGDCGADKVQHSKELLSCSHSGAVFPPSHGVSTKKCVHLLHSQQFSCLPVLGTESCWDSF